MCELMAISSNVELTPNFIFKKMISHSKKKENDEGWGIGFYSKIGKKRRLMIIKEPFAFHNSPFSKKIEKNQIRLRGNLFITHIREATSGNASKKNTHPFTRKIEKISWIFAHNGTIGNIKKKNGVFTIQTKNNPHGQTDSEKGFCYIVDKLKEQKKLNLRERGNLFKHLFKQLKKFGIFNAILSDGEYLYCFGDSKLYYLKKKFEKKDEILDINKLKIKTSNLKKPIEKIVVISTRPLTNTSNTKWIKIKGLKIFKDGEVV